MIALGSSLAGGFLLRRIGLVVIGLALCGLLVGLYGAARYLDTAGYRRAEYRRAVDANEAWAKQLRSANQESARARARERKASAALARASAADGAAGKACPANCRLRKR